jgi:hypothetical protein
LQRLLWYPDRPLLEGAIMGTPTVKETAEMLTKEFAKFEQANPGLAESLKAMNISIADYLKAMAIMKGIPSVSSNANASRSR